MSEKYIIKPFNSVFFVFISLYGIILSVILKFMSHQSAAAKTGFVCLFFALSLAIFYFYKVAISKDEYYWRLCGFDKFNWLNELPLNPCNIVLIFTPVAVLIKSRILMGFCFFASLILSPMALITPGKGFECYPLFEGRIFGYYLTHLMVISSSIMLVSLGFYSPKISDLPPIMLISMAVNFLIYLVNKRMRASGVNPGANYFFNIDTDGNPIFEMCKKIIPYEFLYTVPAFMIFAAVSFLITVVINFIF